MTEEHLEASKKFLLDLKNAKNVAVILKGTAERILLISKPAAMYLIKSTPETEIFTWRYFQDGETIIIENINLG